MRTHGENFPKVFLYKLSCGGLGKISPYVRNGLSNAMINTCSQGTLIYCGRMSRARAHDYHVQTEFLPRSQHVQTTDKPAVQPASHRPASNDIRKRNSTEPVR
jgi:hypothetical protein